MIKNQLTSQAEGTCTDSACLLPALPSIRNNMAMGSQINKCTATLDSVDVVLVDRYSCPSCPVCVLSPNSTLSQLPIDSPQPSPPTPTPVPQCLDWGQTLILEIHS